MSGLLLPHVARSSMRFSSGSYSMALLLVLIPGNALESFCISSMSMSVKHHSFIKEKYCINSSMKYSSVS